MTDYYAISRSVGIRSKINNLKSDVRNKRIESGDAELRIAELEAEYKAVMEPIEKERRLGRIKCSSLLDDQVSGRHSPHAFDVSLSKYPHCHREAVQMLVEGRILPWSYLHGRSGAGKTWAAITTAIDCIRKWSPTDLRFIDAAELKSSLGSLRGDKKEARIQELSYVDILIVDDFGHAISEAFAESFRQILSNRGDDDVTIITSQFSLDEIMDRAKGERYAYTIEAIVRRLDEWATSIEFSKKSDDEIFNRPPDDEEIPF